MTAAYEALDDALREAVHERCSTVLDEEDVWAVVAAVMPVARAHALREYERGIEYGRFVARQAVANRLGLGDLVVPQKAETGSPS